MKDLTREAILRMVGLHDAAHMMRQINAIQLSLEEERGQMVAYWTEIRKSEKEVTLLAGRVAANETNIGQLQVTAQQLTASVSSLTTTVNGHTTSIGQLQITANNLTASVSSISDTVNGHTTKIAALEITDSSISNRVTVIEGDYVKEAEISLMVKKDGNGYISNALIKADIIDFTFTQSTNFNSGGQTVMNIDTGGNLWIKGEYKGGNLTGAMNVGAINAQRKFIITPSDTSGRATISGYDGNNEVIKLGWTYSDPHPLLSMDNDPNILLYSSDHSRTGSLSPTGFTASYNSYIFDIGIGNGLANIILYNGLRFPTLSEADTILASTSYITGVVYMDSNHFLKVRDTNG